MTLNSFLEARPSESTSLLLGTEYPKHRLEHHMTRTWGGEKLGCIALRFLFTLLIDLIRSRARIPFVNPLHMSVSHSCQTAAQVEYNVSTASNEVSKSKPMALTARLRCRRTCFTTRFSYKYFEPILTRMIRLSPQGGPPMKNTLAVRGRQ
jgi:hypothetical protein